MEDKIKEAVKAVRSKVDEVADRVRAEIHEGKAETTDNPVEKLVEKGKAAVDRAKAKVHEEASKAAVKKARR